MEGKCNNCESKKEQACVPFFLHENAMMHYNKANKRMLIALISVLVFVAIMIGIFVYGNTIREKNLIELIRENRVEVQNAEENSPPGI